MKKLLSVKFVWSENVSATGQITYVLTTYIGSVSIVIYMRLFTDERGFYDGDTNPPVFIKDLTKAKKRAERSILTLLKK